ncbi:MAG: PHP domain-containing protein [Verrucomicrobia bacterium]|nr:PHP domain-containing protein [Verrucomicrobiota bacterium]
MRKTLAGAPNNDGPPSNAEIAELLSLETEEAPYILQRAYRRGARSAHLWPIEASDLVAQRRPLTELAHIGPFLEKKIRSWIQRKKHPPRPPALRRGFLTLAQSRVRLGRNPSWQSRLRGDLQMHTSWSDGSGNVLAMADAAIERGYEYIAITDHSKGLSIANGIDEKKLARQAREIAAVNRHLPAAGQPLTVLHSIELNINPVGQGDMNPRALCSLDVVLGSFHSALRRKEDQTKRYLAALRNPYIQILGHPRGRIYNYRAGLRADWEMVFREAARLDKAVEIDAYPDRQDLNVSLLKLACRCGTRISMGTDAHHPWQLQFIDLALAAALIAKISPERIINFMPLDKLRSWVKQVRASEARRSKISLPRCS